MACCCNCCCCTTIEEQHVGVVESLGSFSRFLYPGCSCVNCCTERVAGKISLQVQAEHLKIETKSKNNVFCILHTTYRYHVNPANPGQDDQDDKQAEHQKKRQRRADSKAKKGEASSDPAEQRELLQPTDDPGVDSESDEEADVGPAPVVAPDHVVDDKPRALYVAFYSLSDPRRQMNALIEDAMRSTVAKYDLDHIFSLKTRLANHVKHHVNKRLVPFGYRILQILITDIDPAAEVKQSMNHINAAQRMMVAAEAEAEAAKIRRVKQAEAEAEATHLAGKGIADSRREIIRGLQESVADFGAAVKVPAEELLQVVLSTQYYDTLKEISSHGQSHTLFVPHSAPSGGSGGVGGVPDLRQMMLEATLAAKGKERAPRTRSPSPPGGR